MNNLLSSLKKVWLSQQEFSAGKPVLNIKYYHPRFQNNNLSYLFNDYLYYVLANYFANFETTKRYINILLSNLLIAPLTEKLSY